MVQLMEHKLCVSLVCFAGFYSVTLVQIGNRTITNGTITNETRDDAAKCGECTIILFVNVKLL